MTAMSDDYQRIERALGFLSRHALDQPALDEAAAHVGLGPHHFQKMFTRWAGVSPKKFIQHLTLERAKERLDQSASVLEAAWDVGLSGPGRLHDLFVAHEAITPGEHKLRGQGLSIAYGWVDSPFGEALILTTPRGICGLAFALDGRERTLDDMKRRWPRATFSEDTARVERLASDIFAPPGGPGRRDGGRLRLVMHGSPFQIKVWEALLRIPPGALASYESLAGVVTGSPRGARAVGAAVGANPIGYLIPCHRVIRKSGEISRYHWGQPRKLAMLGWEAHNAG